MPITVTDTSFVEFPDRQGILESLRVIEVYDSAMEPMFRQVADRLDSRAYDRSAFVFILLELIYELDTDSITFSDLLGRVVFCLTDDLDLVGEALEAFEEIQETLSPGRSSTAASTPAVSEEPRSKPTPGGPPADDNPSTAEVAVEPSAAEEAAAPSRRITGVARSGRPRLRRRGNGQGAGPGATATTGDRREAEASSSVWAHEADREHLMLELQGTQKRVLDFGLATRVSIEMALAHPSRANVQQTLRDISELRKNLLRFEELLRESEEKILQAIGVFD
ncbi:MAG: hypothetical protein MI919_11525 [Holophagales bacterium]|nr:hypothetical protein [Holophagales bacterium]